MFYQVKNYSINYNENIIHMYGISQHPVTKDYIIILQYANCGNFNDYINNYVMDWIWSYRLYPLTSIISGLTKIHKNKMVHRDFHSGNILSSFFEYRNKHPLSNNIFIS